MVDLSREALVELAERVEKAEADNALDVLAEVALFRADDDYASARSNAAGTKVIYTDHDGKDWTCWAPDWTIERNRHSTAAALRARSAASS